FGDAPRLVTVVSATGVNEEHLQAARALAVEQCAGGFLHVIGDWPLAALRSPNQRSEREATSGGIIAGRASTESSRRCRRRRGLARSRATRRSFRRRPGRIVSGRPSAFGCRSRPA